MKRISNALSSALRAANHDFCPNVNQYVYWIKKPIGWVAAGCLFSLLIGLFVGPQGYVLAFAFFALMILGLAWPWLSMKGIRCSLSMPYGQLNENEAAKLVLTVNNYWPIPVFGMMIEGDFLQDIDANEERIAFSLKRVPALSATEFPIEIVPRRRGLLPCGEIRVKNGFPFGLADVARPIEDIKTSIVWPACEPLEGSPPAEGSHFNLFGAMSDRSGNDGETIGVRAYRQGDRMRNIHWAQTVRSQRLMVRDRQTPSSTSATVLLDLHPDNHTGDGVNSSYEWAIRIAASICCQLHRTRSRVKLVCLGLLPQSPHSVGNQHGIDAMMDFLANLPTLRTQKLNQQAHPGASASSEPGKLAGRIFIVCTSHSTMGSLNDLAIQPILLRVDGFVSEGEDESQRRQQCGAETVAPNDGMIITAPNLASCQLGSAWRESYGHATG